MLPILNLGPDGNTLGIQLQAASWTPAGGVFSTMFPSQTSASEIRSVIMRETVPSESPLCRARSARDMCSLWRSSCNMATRFAPRFCLGRSTVFLRLGFVPRSLFPSESKSTARGGKSSNQRGIDILDFAGRAANPASCRNVPADTLRTSNWEVHSHMLKRMVLFLALGVICRATDHHHYQGTAVVTYQGETGQAAFGMEDLTLSTHRSLACKHSSALH